MPEPIRTPDAAITPPFTVWLEAEGVYSCEDCGAWQPVPGEPLGHNRTCKHYWTVAADAYVREALRSLPEGKEILYSSLGETVVLVAKGQAALDLWYEWMKPRLVDAYVAEVRRVSAE